jgi:hypothetical protein
VKFQVCWDVGCIVLSLGKEIQDGSKDWITFIFMDKESMKCRLLVHEERVL